MNKISECTAKSILVDYKCFKNGYLSSIIFQSKKIEKYIEYNGEEAEITFYIGSSKV